MFLQNPLALIALLGLLVPLLIHLWERRQGPRVLIGSIRWLEAAEEQRVSRLQFTDLWRWLLRSLIVILFAFLLAGPGWWSKAADIAKSHWVLVEPLPQEAALIEVLDSLARAGRSVRWLADDFPEWQASGVVPPYDSSANYWHALQAIGMRPDRPDTVTVLAWPQLRHFRGARPALPFAVRWQPLPEQPPTPFVAAAWEGEAKIRLLLGNSGPERVDFRQVDIPASAGRHDLPAPFPPLYLETGERPSDWRVRLAGEKAPPMAVGSLPYRFVRIYYDRSYNDDQRYLRAALRAAAAFTGIPIEISWLPVEKLEAPEEAPEKAPPREEWLFWLSDTPLPEELRAAYAPRLACYTASDHPIAPSSFFRAVDTAFILQGISEERSADPEDAERLPAELIEVLFADEIQLPAGADRRYLDERQLLPLFRAERAQPEAAVPQQAPLHRPLWLALCALFLIERLTALRKG